YNYNHIIPPGLAGKSLWSVWLISFSGPLFFVLLNNSVYEAMYFFGQYKSLIQIAEQLKKQQARKQLDALKSRVNPHFLFNSLTTLSALIAEDAPRAERFVDELSKVYRYLLRAGREEKVTLIEELQFADSYVFLLQNRFEDGAFSLDKSGIDGIPFPGKEKCLPVLSFQNALDFLVRTQHVPLHIRLSVHENELIFQCRHQPKSLAFDAAGNDWLPLQNQGASRLESTGNLLISIPLVP
ncbi:MAG: histidine kinase, partial [Saprospiraceae bacterium]|nr:histidine kinase [Saprospiraceae bacterium]